jgi:hypothetical protein
MSKPEMCESQMQKNKKFEKPRKDDSSKTKQLHNNTHWQ